jgi:hypothetical protein
VVSLATLASCSNPIDEATSKLAVRQVIENQLNAIAERDPSVNLFVRSIGNIFGGLVKRQDPGLLGGSPDSGSGAAGAGQDPFASSPSGAPGVPIDASSAGPDAGAGAGLSNTPPPGPDVGGTASGSGSGAAAGPVIGLANSPASAPSGVPPSGPPPPAGQGTGADQASLNSPPPAANPPPPAGNAPPPAANPQIVGGTNAAAPAPAPAGIDPAAAGANAPPPVAAAAGSAPSGPLQPGNAPAPAPGVQHQHNQHSHKGGPEHHHPHHVKHIPKPAAPPAAAPPSPAGAEPAGGAAAGDQSTTFPPASAFQGPPGVQGMGAGPVVNAPVGVQRRSQIPQNTQDQAMGAMNAGFDQTLSYQGATGSTRKHHKTHQPGSHSSHRQGAMRDSGYTGEQRGASRYSDESPLPVEGRPTRYSASGTKSHKNKKYRPSNFSKYVGPSEKLDPNHSSHYDPGHHMVKMNKRNAALLRARDAYIKKREAEAYPRPYAVAEPNACPNPYACPESYHWT